MPPHRVSSADDYDFFIHTICDVDNVYFELWTGALRGIKSGPSVLDTSGVVSLKYISFIV